LQEGLCSEPDDLDETFESLEVVGMASIESESVGMGGRGDEQVCDSKPVGGIGLVLGCDRPAVVRRMTP
jgi:hypothetical protein